MKLVIDLATDRIIWFGDDSFPLDETNIEGAALAFYDGSAPPGMTGLNCWNYKFYDQKILSPSPKSLATPESPVDAARKIVLKQMGEAVEKHQVSRGMPDDIPSLLLLISNELNLVRSQVYGGEFGKLIDVIQSTETLYSRYWGRVRDATTTTALHELRADFMKALNEI